MKRLLLWLDTRRLATAILFVALFAMAVRAPADTDTWWHLHAGRVTLEQGHILKSDLFSHTRYGSSWVAYTWLSEVMLYWLFRHFSYAGLGLWMGTLVTTAFAFVYLQMEGDAFTRAFIVVAAAAASAVVWVARPHLCSFLLTAVVAYVLYLFKWRRVNRLWLLPPLFALWVNLHAAYAQGFMIMAAFVAGEVFNGLLAPFAPSDDPLVDWRGIGTVLGVAILCALCLVIHPNTTRMWTYPLETVSIGVLQDFIQEWQSPNFHPLYTQPFIWLLLATLAAMGLSGRRADGIDLALVCLFAYAALLAGRNIAPFALVVAPVLSRHAAAILSRCRRVLQERGWLGTLRRRPPTPTLGVLHWCTLALVVALAAIKVYTPLRPTFNETLQRESLPVEAVDWIQTNRPAGKMFNLYQWGGYLMWRLWPDYLVFVDGRTDLYGDEILRDYVEIQYAGPQALPLLERYDVSFVVTSTDDALSTLLRCQEDWHLAYQDRIATIWEATAQ